MYGDIQKGQLLGKKMKGGQELKQVEQDRSILDLQVALIWMAHDI